MRFLASLLRSFLFVFKSVVFVPTVKSMTSTSNSGLIWGQKTNICLKMIAQQIINTFFFHFLRICQSNVLFFQSHFNLSSKIISEKQQVLFFTIGLFVFWSKTLILLLTVILYKLTVVLRSIWERKLLFNSRIVKILYKGQNFWSKFLKITFWWIVL